MQYIYNEEADSFSALNFNLKATFQEIHDNFLNGLTDIEFSYLRKIFGICDLEVTIASVGMLILKEITDPFYLFQVFCFLMTFLVVFCLLMVLEFVRVLCVCYSCYYFAIDYNWSL